MISINVSTNKLQSIQSFCVLSLMYIKIMCKKKTSFSNIYYHLIHDIPEAHEQLYICLYHTANTQLRNTSTLHHLWHLQIQNKNSISNHFKFPVNRLQTSTTPRCSRPIPAQKIQGISVPGVVFSHTMPKIDFYHSHRFS